MSDSAELIKLGARQRYYLTLAADIYLSQVTPEEFNYYCENFAVVYRYAYA